MEQELVVEMQTIMSVVSLVRGMTLVAVVFLVVGMMVVVVAKMLEVVIAHLFYMTLRIHVSVGNIHKVSAVVC